MRLRLFDLQRARRHLTAAALLTGIAIAGGFSGIGLRAWSGGLGGQRTQLHRCILASQSSHPNEGASMLMAHFDAEVPECMAGAGYEKRLENDRCNVAMWQGDVYCYLPKSAIGKLAYRIGVLAAGSSQAFLPRPTVR